MNKSVRKRVWTSLAVIASLALVGVVVAGAASARGHEPEVVCKKIGKRKVSCPKKELHGKRGKPGASGPTGAQGATGPAGPAGIPGANGSAIPLIFRGSAPTPNETILSVGGLVITATCSTGSVTTLTGVPQIAGSVIRATDAITGETEASNDTFLNEHFSLNPNETQDDYLLTYLAGNGSTIVTANYGVANGGLGLLNVSCAVFGSVQLTAG
jgi:hypothetical protein